MGNQGSKGSLQKTNSMTNNINFVSNYSSGYLPFKAASSPSKIQIIRTLTKNPMC